MYCYGHIYIITCKINGKLYIGQTTYTVEQRWHQHLNASKKKKWAISAAIRKHGAENFEIIHYASCFDAEGLNIVEEDLIKEYNCLVPYGYNLASGGLSHLHHELSKKKISESKVGKPRSPETIAKMSAANIGKVVSEENKAKMSARLKGKKFTEEHKKKISQALKGKTKHPLTQEHKDRISKTLTGRVGHSPTKEQIEKMCRANRKPIVDENGIVYPSISEAARALGCLKTAICNVLRGRRKTAKGHTFKYME
jgi:group I intron endonuclease